MLDDFPPERDAIKKSILEIWKDYEICYTLLRQFLGQHTQALNINLQGAHIEGSPGAKIQTIIVQTEQGLKDIMKEVKKTGDLEGAIKRRDDALIEGNKRIAELEKQIEQAERKAKKTAEQQVEQLQRIILEREAAEKVEIAQALKAKEEHAAVEQAEKELAAAVRQAAQLKALEGKQQAAIQQAVEIQAVEYVKQLETMIEQLQKLIMEKEAAEKAKVDAEKKARDQLKAEQTAKAEVKNIEDKYEDQLGAMKKQLEEQEVKIKAQAKQIQELCVANEILEKARAVCQIQATQKAQVQVVQKQSEIEVEQVAEEIAHAAEVAYTLERERRTTVAKRNPRLQNVLVKACEAGNLAEVKDLLQQGADASQPDNTGKCPLGAAVWGMNPEVVSALLDEMKDEDCLSWEECKAHNERYYNGEVFMFVLFAPETFTQWHALLIKMSCSPYLSALHLGEVKDGDTSSWGNFVSWVQRKAGECRQKNEGNWGPRASTWTTSGLFVKLHTELEMKISRLGEMQKLRQ